MHPAVFTLLVPCALLLNGAAFVVARYAVARARGIASLRVAAGLDRAAWGRHPHSVRWLFVASGPIACYLCSAALTAVGLMLAGEVRVDESSLRVEVAPSGAASAAGLERGDTIVAIDDAKVETWPALRAKVREAAAQRRDGGVRVAYTRGGEERVADVALGPAARLGVAPFREEERVALVPAVTSGLALPFRLVGDRVRARIEIAIGSSAELSGPIAIVRSTPSGAPGFGQGLKALGALNAAYLWLPLALALLLFPRGAPRTGVASA
jgi:membrane-associated protease RseP (regulator of RpoE activity)